MASTFASPRPSNGLLADRRILLAADAATCLPFGALLAVFSAPIARWTGLPVGVLFEAGLFLIAFAAVLVALAARAIPSARTMAIVAIANALWIVGSIELLVVASDTVTPLGIALVLAQAVAVAVLTVLEWRSRRT